MISKMLPTLSMTSNILLIIFMFFTTATNNEDLEMPAADSESQVRIWNGQKARAGEFAFQAFLYVTYDDGNSGICGGSLISNKSVLTAAHCCYRVEKILVHLGLINLSNAKEDYIQRIEVLKHNIKIHKKYDINTIANDICVLQMPSAAVLNSNVSIVTLPYSNDTNPAQYNQQMATVSGWGQTRNYSGPNPILLWSGVRLQPHISCVMNYLFINKVSHSQLCSAKFPKTGPCHGDSGGPLIITDKFNKTFQLGLVSWGVGSCGSGNAVVYTYVPAYVNWIKGNML